MGVVQTLAKVAAEVEEGSPAAVLRALQRLRGLVGTYPDRLDLRDKLAEVYRTLGDPVQAGRWGYLAEQRVPAETAAFERAYRDPVDRMLALGWRHSPDHAQTAPARERLTTVLEAASRQAGRPLTYTWREDPAAADWSEPWWEGAAFYALLGSATLLMGIGLVTVLRWLGCWLFGWFC